MHIRLAALIVVIATLILSFNSPSRLEAKYAELNATCLGNKGGTSHVVEACSAVLADEGTNPAQQSALLRARGWASYHGKQYKDAISDFDMILALQSDDTITLLMRAFAHDALGNTQAAEEDYTNTVLMVPNNVYALYYKARFDHRWENICEAIQGYEKVLEINPGYRNTGTLLTNVYLDLEGVDGAGRFLRLAEQQWPEQSRVYDFQLFIDLKYTGDVDSALQAATEYAKIEPQAGKEVLLLALVHLKIGDENKGIEYVKELAGQNFTQQSTFTRWYQNSLSWIAFGKSDQWVSRFLAYASFGRTDLAKEEVDAFLHDTGKNGRTVFLRLVQKAGIPVSAEAKAGSPAQLEKTIMRYLKHVEETSSFKKYDPQGSG